MSKYDIKTLANLFNDKASKMAEYRVSKMNETEFQERALNILDNTYGQIKVTGKDYWVTSILKATDPDRYEGLIKEQDQNIMGEELEYLYENWSLVFDEMGVDMDMDLRRTVMQRIL